MPEHTINTAKEREDLTNAILADLKSMFDVTSHRDEAKRATVIRCGGHQATICDTLRFPDFKEYQNFKEQIAITLARIQMGHLEIV